MKHGLPKTAKIRMIEYVSSLKEGDIFTSRDLTNYVNLDGRLDMTPNRVGKWCSTCPSLIHTKAGEWMKAGITPC